MNRFELRSNTQSRADVVNPAQNFRLEESLRKEKNSQEEQAVQKYLRLGVLGPVLIPVERER